MKTKTNIRKDAAVNKRQPPDFHEQVANLAYVLWRERGCPDGSPDTDWFRAEEQLQHVNRATSRR
jgi:Protein of unknown function (DUF2934)